MKKALDPRIIRTRKLIMDAFLQLSMQKDFKEITIKDITSIATINRATFYYHFVDKYELLEVAMRETVMNDVIQTIAMYNKIDETTLKAIFNSLINFQLSTYNQCQSRHEAFAPQIENILKKELQMNFFNWAQNQWPAQDTQQLTIMSNMLSWAMYGASAHYLEAQQTPAEHYVDLVIHQILSGLTVKA